MSSYAHFLTSYTIRKRPSLQIFLQRRSFFMSDFWLSVEQTVYCAILDKSASTATVVVVAATSAATAVVAPAAVTAAVEQDNDKDNDPTAVTSAKTKSTIVHIRTLLLIMYLKPLRRCFRRCFILHYMAAAEKCYSF